LEPLCDPAITTLDADEALNPRPPKRYNTPGVVDEVDEPTVTYTSPALSGEEPDPIKTLPEDVEDAEPLLNATTPDDTPFDEPTNSSPSDPATLDAPTVIVTEPD